MYLEEFSPEKKFLMEQLKNTSGQSRRNFCNPDLKMSEII